MNVRSAVIRSQSLRHVGVSPPHPRLARQIETTLPAAVYRTIDNAEQYPPHPGEILREDILPHVALPRREIARHLGISAHLLAELLAERRSVTLDLARRLGECLGQGARYWLSLQIQHDLWRAAEPMPLAVKPITWGKATARR